MGLAASQARALLLIARKSDLEYRAQCISQRKLVLSQQTEQLAKNYSSKISNRKLRFVYNEDASNGKTLTEDFSYYSLGAQNPRFVGEYRLLNNRGDIVVASVNEIPQKAVQVPVYTLVSTNSEGNTSAVTTSEDIYSEASANDLGAKKTLYALGEDGQYVKVQENDGSQIDNATINIKSVAADGTVSYITTNVFNKDEDGNNTLADGIQLYTKGTKSTAVTTTEPDTSKLAEGQSYRLTGYKTVYENRQQEADGYYYSDDRRRYVVCADVASNTYFQNGLRTGAFVLQKAENVEQRDENNILKGSTTSWSEVTWQGIDVIQDVLYTEDDALAESEYEAKTAAIKAQDQMLDLELKQIETQHKAIETEQESVDKVIKGNIDKTFKIFANG